jgi:hypothetical protein
VTNRIEVLYKESVKFELHANPASKCFFVLGVRKSGSSLLNNIVKTLATHNNLNFVDVGGTLFEGGFQVADWQDDPALSEILIKGNVYGGFRNSPKAFYKSEYFRKGSKILLVRDPRDALVSEYFSNAYSHSVPESGSSRAELLNLRQLALEIPIEEYVLRMVRPMKQTLREYRFIIDDPSCRVFRYEDVIFDKAGLMRDICEFFRWEASNDLRDHILRWADVRPSEERPTEFIRRVTPGDYKEKLSNRTIKRLTSILAAEMAMFGYAL